MGNDPLDATLCMHNQLQLLCTLDTVVRNLWSTPAGDQRVSVPDQRLYFRLSRLLRLLQHDVKAIAD